MSQVADKEVVSKSKTQREDDENDDKDRGCNSGRGDGAGIDIKSISFIVCKETEDWYVKPSLISLWAIVELRRDLNSRRRFLPVLVFCLSFFCRKALFLETAPFSITLPGDKDKSLFTKFR